jgi:hypothetical protein
VIDLGDIRALILNQSKQAAVFNGIKAKGILKSLEFMINPQDINIHL